MVSAQLLRHYPAFAGAQERSVEAVAAISEEKTFPAGEVIFKEGSLAQRIFFVAAGEVDLFFNTRDDKVIVDTLVPGDLMGWSTMVEPHLMTASAVARTEVRLVAIEADKLKKIFESDCLLGFSMLKQVVGSLSHRLKACHVQLASCW
jgi:CRP/FNR family cyclic AMP-dependent transcriptional regulator